MTEIWTILSVYETGLIYEWQRHMIPLAHDNNIHLRRTHILVRRYSSSRSAPIIARARVYIARVSAALEEFLAVCDGLSGQQDR